MRDKVHAVVVGVGRAGSRFDEEPGRTTVWSHVGAYLALPKSYLLAGACEIAKENAEAFHRRCPSTPLYESVADMMKASNPHVVSICTPPESHAKVLDAVLAKSDVRVVWCEKPLAMNLSDATRMVESCARRNVKLVVSHVRRWQPIWRRFKQRLDDGAVGHPRCIRVAMPNRLWSVGSHAVDLALMLGGSATSVKAIDLAGLHEEGEPAVAALMNLLSGAYAILQVTGRRERLIVEAEIVGDRGRMVAREDLGTITVENFVSSGAYNGYLQLAEPTVEKIVPPDGFSPFIAVAEEIARLLSQEQAQPTCDGSDALEVQRVLAAMDGDRHSVPTIC